eukprot:TRINITY_DN1041_c0_g1_i8.p1 TRINITY_DN1041_c0_g1~~TRINITY_DN1041_c0_g1_i8.p1  ORF type:complete len:311 (+),score=46.97 TRINITY_DN1041_c0_g1_i8:25-933(+)
MIRRPPRSTPLYSSAASDVYKRQVGTCIERSQCVSSATTLAFLYSDTKLCKECSLSHNSLVDYPTTVSRMLQTAVDHCADTQDVRCTIAVKPFYNAQCKAAPYYLTYTQGADRATWPCAVDKPTAELLAAGLFDDTERIYYAASTGVVTCGDGTHLYNNLCLTCDPSCGRIGCIESANASACVDCARSIMYLEVGGQDESENATEYGTCRTEEDIMNDPNTVDKPYYKDPHARKVYRGGCPVGMRATDDSPAICYGKASVTVAVCPTMYKTVNETACVSRANGAEWVKCRVALAVLGLFLIL